MSKHYMITIAAWVVVLFVWTLTALAEPIVDSSIVDRYDKRSKRGKEPFNIGLQMMVDFEKLPCPKDASAKHESSYDTTGGNYDRGNFLNGDYFTCAHSPEGCIMVEADGPGLITRIWHTSLLQNNARFNFYIDNQPDPIISCKRNELFNRGLCYPFVDLFVGDAINSAGGYYSYFPIPFSNHMRISVTELSDDFYYNVDYLIFPAGTDITSFAESLSQKDEENFQKILNIWHNLGENPINDSTSTIIEGSVSTAPAETTTLAQILGMYSIIELRLSVIPSDTNTLKSLTLKIYWDHEKSPSVDVPLGAFFGNGIRHVLFKSQPIGATENGFYSYFPMPFYSCALLQIVNNGTQNVFLSYRVAYQALAFYESFYKFHARWSEQNPTVTGVNYVALDISGTGHYVGTTLSIRSDNDWQILEGDEMIYVDGGIEPTIHGTGTEDYFNCGWSFYDQNFLELPYHGLSLLEPDKNGRYDFSTFQYDSGGLHSFSAHRFHISDIIPFTSSIKVSLEHGPTNDVNGIYSSVAYYYLYECPAQICGNVNCDFMVNFGDVVYLINYLFKGGSTPHPFELSDVNLDGKLDMGDLVYLINYFFKDGSAPCEP